MTCQKKKLSNVLKTCSTVSFLFLTACASCFPTYPDVRPKQYLKNKGYCVQYKIVDFNNITFRYEKDLTLDECLAEGSFVLSDAEIVALRRAWKEAKACYEKQCKGQK